MSDERRGQEETEHGAGAFQERLASDKGSTRMPAAPPPPPKGGRDDDDDDDDDSDNSED